MHSECEFTVTYVFLAECVIHISPGFGVMDQMVEWNFLTNLGPRTYVALPGASHHIVSVFIFRVPRTGSRVVFIYFGSMSLPSCC